MSSEEELVDEKYPSSRAAMEIRILQQPGPFVRRKTSPCSQKRVKINLFPGTKEIHHHGKNLRISRQVAHGLCAEITFLNFFLTL